MARTIAKLVAALAIVAAAHSSGAPPAAPTTPRVAAVEHRAAVVVHTGSQVFTGCVRFSEDSISGKEALERADMRPVFRAYSGQGTAVCSLCGKGCPADDSCLTCGGNNYWAYHRARAGATAYTPSQAGVSSTRVRDGDVEGWQWGPGTPPPYYRVDQICPAAAPPPAEASPAPEPAPSPPPPANEPSSPSNPAPSARIAPTTVAAPVATNPVEITTTSAVSPPASDVGTTQAPNEVSGAPVRRLRSDDSESGAPTSLLAFAALMAALIGWAIWARRRRPRGGG